MSAQPLLVGVDVGTSGARAVAVDADGRVVADATSAYPLSQPRPGWSEQDPDDWWRAAREVLARVALAGEVVGIGLTGQMHGSAFLDAAGAVVRPALLWNDGRTAAQCDWITARAGAERLIAIAGNPALTGFQAPKIVWLRDHEPDHYQRVRHVLLPKDVVRLRLTGELATDVSDAAGTLLLDMRARDWSDELLAALEIPRAWLPRVLEGPEVSGRLLPDVARELGLPAGIPVVAGGGDNAAAAVGTGIVRPGLLSVSIGTSGVLFAHSDTFAPDPSGRLHAFCHAVPGAYHLMGVTLAAGGSLAWWRDLLASDYATLADEAAETPPGSEGLLFLPYLSGERTPHMDPLARGAFIGLSTRHTRAHLTRAVIEGVALSLRDALTIMRELGVPVSELRAVGGGARHPLWRQVLADILAAPIRRTTAEEGPAYGAALLAGIGAGVFHDIADATARVTLRDELTTPDPATTAHYDEQYAAFTAAWPAVRATTHLLAETASRAPLVSS